MSVFFDVEKGSTLHRKMLMWSSFSVLFALLFNMMILLYLSFSYLDKKPPENKNNNTKIVGIYGLWVMGSIFTLKSIEKRTLITHAPITLPIFLFLFFIYRHLRKKYPQINDVKLKRKILIKKWGLK
jgi:hypothetical protein